MGQEEAIKEEEEEEQQQRWCDFCGHSKALVYCRADSARLCLACDRHVHAANSVSSKHPRSLLCDSCRSAPSSILCAAPAHGQILCSNCDFAAHHTTGHGHGTHHQRRPVEPFSGCPTALDLVSALGLGEDEKEVLKKKKNKEDDEDGGGGGWGLVDRECWVWNTPQVVRLDDLIVPTTTTSSHAFQAMGIPPLPKNRNLACGKQKEEILRQLSELIKSETQLTNDCEEIDPVTELQSLLPKHKDHQDNLPSDFDGEATFTITPSYEASKLQWNNNDWHKSTGSLIFSDDQHLGSSSAVIPSFSDGIIDFHTVACPASGGDEDPRNHTIRENQSPLTPKAGLELLCPDRDTVISRYKEKRKTRRYDKLIRYESRKARADSRVRIKGRFAKVNQVPKS